MAQGYDKYELPNSDGASFRNNLNLILRAAVEQNSGPDAPNTTNTSYPYQVWVDTDALSGSGAVVKIRDAAAAGTWYSLYKTDANGQPTGAVATGSYSISTNDTAGTGGTMAITVDTSQRVGIGNTSPSAKLYVSASTTKTGGDINANADELVVDNSGGNTGITLKCPNTASGRIAFGDPEDNNVGQINYSHASNSMQFQVNGFERGRFDNSGRLLVGPTEAATGTESQYSRLVVAGNTNSGTAAGILNIRKNSGAGSTDYLGRLVYSDDDHDFAYIDGIADGSTTAGRLVFSTCASGGSSPTERMRIKSDGLVRVATNNDTNDYALLSPEGFVSTETSLTTLRTHHSFRNPNGEVGKITTNGTATAYVTSSDYRLKENVTAVTDGITRLQQLKPSRFNFIADPTKTVDGFLAHEVQTAVPEAITGEKDAVDEDGNPEYQGIDQSKLVPLLTAALQEAIAKIETLEARVAALESA